jgi:hypothetical protein
MNLVMDVLRLIAVRAIRGNTWVGQAVLDSPASPGDIRVRGNRAPFISVYVDEADMDLSETGSIAMFGQGHTVRMVLEVGVASAHKFDAEGQRVPDDQPVPAGGHEVTSLDATDEGLEMQMGLIARQAMDALTSTATTNPWAEIFRTFTAGSFVKVDVRRGGQSGDQKNPAPRYASRVLILHMQTLGEPPRGADLEDWPAWSMFFAACEGDPEYGEIAGLIRDHIVKPSGPLPEWRMAQKLLHIPLATANILGMAPALRTDDQVAVMDKVLINGEGEGL